MSGIAASAPAGRDLALRKVRVVAWGIGAAAVGSTAALSVVAANAFRGHSGTSRVVAAISRRHVAASRVSVPPPQDVPPISGDPAALQPPSEPPGVAEEQGPAPSVSGGS